MDISKIKYNQALIKTKIRLDKELNMVNKELCYIQEECKHISICLGFNGSYQYRDTSIHRCLFCGDVPVDCVGYIDATCYKYDEYGYGSISEYRYNRFIDIQNLWMELVMNNPELSQEEVIDKMNNLMQTEKEKVMLKFKSNK